MPRGIVSTIVATSIAALLAAGAGAHPAGQLEARPGGERPGAVGQEPNPDSQYVRPERFNLATNRSWSGAREVSPPARTGGSRNDRTAYVWASTCSRGTQAVRFTRKVVIPSEPASLLVGYGFVTQPNGRRTAAKLKSIEIRVNGVTIVRGRNVSGSGPNGTVRRGLLGAFVHGANTLEIRAVKAPTPASAPCNVGLLVHLTGTPAADLRIAHPDDRETIFTRKGQVVERRDIVQPVTFKIRNDGPSTAASGTLTFRVTFTGAALASIRVEPTAPLECSAEASRGDVTCSFEAFPPGASADVKITVGVPLEFHPQSGVDKRLGFSWRAYSLTPDPDPSNNSFTWAAVFCAPRSLLPGC